MLDILLDTTKESNLSYNKRNSGWNPWWLEAQLDENIARSILQTYPVNEDTLTDRASEVLMRRAMLGGLPLRIFRVEAILKKDLLIEIDHIVKKWKGSFILEEINVSQSSLQTWVWPEGAISIKIQDRFKWEEEENGSNQSSMMMEIRFVTQSIDQLGSVQALIDSHKCTIPQKTPSPEGMAFVLSINSLNEIELVPIGIAGQTLTRCNYPIDVLRMYDRAVSDMNEITPKGRLTVLDGPPGTGKTFMVRAFMHDSPETKFVIVPPHMAQKLADPSLIFTFIREFHMGRRPLVLVLEDADQCLLKRNIDNMASVNSILNLTDGILGNLLDIRILATSNTPAHDLDDALLRPGRISAHIKMCSMNTDEIKNVWNNLAGSKIPLPDNLLLKKQVVLADIYSEYNNIPEIDRLLGDIEKASN